MESVSPFKKLEEIEKLKQYFKSTNIRDYLLYVISINLPFNLNYILNLKVRELYQNTLLAHEINGFTIQLPNYIEKDLLQLIHLLKLEPSDYLFQSQRTKQPLTRQQAYRIIKEGVKQTNIQGSYGMLSLKKTFAYHAYQQGMEITSLQHLLGHQSKYETYKFIEVEPIIRTNINLNL